MIGVKEGEINRRRNRRTGKRKERGANRIKIVKKRKAMEREEE